MQSDFNIEISSNDSVPIVRIWGEVDIHNCPQLNRVLSDVLKENDRSLVIDLEGVDYIDSTGLGTIAHAAKILAATQGIVQLVCTKPQIKKIFEISGLSQKNVNLVSSEAAALGVTQ